MKDQIVTRLLEQGHITVLMADALLNNLLEKTRIITDLNADGIISIQETIALLKESEEKPIWYQPVQPQTPVMPYQPPYNPGDPYWHVTCSMDTGLNRD